jgi:hypothetical protein
MAFVVDDKVLFWQEKKFKIVAEIIFSKLSRAGQHATENGIIFLTSVTVV